MIGIVLVSHSRALAQAAVGLATEMVEASDLPRVVVAAGLDETTFGTDAAAIAEAIGEADSKDGVLVLLDLGSAILSAEMALEFIDADVAQRVALTSAAMVEGLVAAVVTASSGAGLSAVKAEAERGLRAKREHLDDVALVDGASGEPSADSAAAGSLAPGAATRQLRIDIPHGLHARPAARFVACVSRFEGTRVRIRNLDGADREADASSLSAVASLGVRQGDRMQIAAEGDHAEEALEALVALAEANFGDSATDGTPTPTTAGQASATSVGAEQGRRAPAMGSGLEAALGVVLRVDEAVDVADYEGSGDLITEKDRLGGAIEAAITELDAIASTTKDQVGSAEGEVFEAHAALLQDSGFTDPAFKEITDGVPAALAWRRAGEALAADFARLSDEYQRERAQDMRSITHRVLRQLIHGGQVDPLEEVGGGLRILVVHELDPATAVQVDPEQIAGIVTIGGGSTGHGVLIASARGIPVLTGVRQADQFRDGTVIAFDARDRRVIVDPSDQERSDFEQLLDDRATQQDLDRAAATMPGQTKDGLGISVKANVTSASEAAQAVELGAEGSGLVRTEVMFGGWSSAPSVGEQVVEFAAVAEALEGRVMTIRTWDIGADKPLGFWAQDPEQNPFLGVRGLRSFTDDPTLLREQLEAVCLVAQEHPLRVMFPMVATVEEVQWALDQLAHAGERLDTGVPESLEVGIMIEVPAAALRAEAMSSLLDFVSVGTNDLTQYTLAAERGNAGVEHLFDPLDPSVLALIAQVCRDVADGVSVGVCGGAASDPAAASLLVGLGVDDVSATPVAVPRVKAVLRRHTLEQLQDLAQRALRCDSAAEVRGLLAGLA